MLTRRWIFGLLTLPFATSAAGSFWFGGVEFVTIQLTASRGKTEMLHRILQTGAPEVDRDWSKETYASVQMAVHREVKRERAMRELVRWLAL